MQHYVPLSAMSFVKDVLSVLGAAGALGATIFGIWLALRKRAEAKQKERKEEGIALHERFATLEHQVDHLQTTTGSVEQQYAELRTRVTKEQQEMVRQLDEIQNKCSYHQQAADLTALDQEVTRLQGKLDRMDSEFRVYRDQIAEKYITLASYQNDLVLWTKAFDDLRQSMRDVHLMLSTRS